MALTDNLNAYFKLDDATDSVASYDLTDVGSVPFEAWIVDNGIVLKTK